ncbi:rCG37811 [Rattus norvegicus]|uniref:RCG37811 n=1 Tax=Rattus norvegicus TaxID=10116 RepID=A6K656_RAT|nr:rCG37811 [Rattus norvegicus]
MCSLVFMWVPNNRSSGCPKSCCLYVGYVLLAGLSGLASVGEEAPSFAERWCVRVWGQNPGNSHLLRGRE